MPISSNDLPLALMDDLAWSESFRRDVYRPVYSIHKWWARRPGSTFRVLGLAALSDSSVDKDAILRQDENGNYRGMYLGEEKGRLRDEAVVLDPFMGGGVTPVELSRLGAQVIGYELNPVAWWISKKSMETVDIELLDTAFEKLVDSVTNKVGNLYQTDSPEGAETREVLYYFLAQVVDCLTCEEQVRLFPRYILGSKKATRPATVYCPNSTCTDRIIALHRAIEESETCPSCGDTFSPKEGNCGYGKFTCSRGHKHDIKEAVARSQGAPRYECFALQYVGKKGVKKFKVPSNTDLDAERMAGDLLSQHAESLPIPSQEIPEGDKTRALLNYNYTYFRELFTDRQLLTYGLLFKNTWPAARAAINETAMDAHSGETAENLAEFLITAISNSLEYNSKLCTWHYGDQKGFNVFKRHAYIPRTQPVEPNPLTAEVTSSSLRNQYEKLRRGKKYCAKPFEKIKHRTTGEVKRYSVDGETVNGNSILGLRCQTSERLVEDDCSVDYVITDPPYYDNVQYSELSNYFYVWLQQCLKDQYREFRPRLVPSAREIVANRAVGKDDDFFVEALGNVFKECFRVLKDQGEMVFTYHHNSGAAWSVIIKALMQSGFTVTGAYPVQSEMPNNPHIGDLDNTEYDIIVTANKEKKEGEITLKELKQTLYLEVQEWMQAERRIHEDLSTADLGVVLRGRCLYHLSRHYPHITDSGSPVEVDDALTAADSVVGYFLLARSDLPEEIDEVTRAYVEYLARTCEQEVGSSGESFDELRKHLMARGIEVDDLESRRLIEGGRTKKYPVSPIERAHYLERKIRKREEVPVIDKLHWLYFLYVTDQTVGEHLREWHGDELEAVAKRLHEITGDEVYERAVSLQAVLRDG